MPLQGSGAPPNPVRTRKKGREHGEHALRYMGFSQNQILTGFGGAPKPCKGKMIFLALTRIEGFLQRLASTGSPHQSFLRELHFCKFTIHRCNLFCVALSTSSPRSLPLFLFLPAFVRSLLPAHTFATCRQRQRKRSTRQEAHSCSSCCAGGRFWSRRCGRTGSSSRTGRPPWISRQEQRSKCMQRTDLLGDLSAGHRDHQKP